MFSTSMCFFDTVKTLIFVNSNFCGLSRILFSCICKFMDFLLQSVHAYIHSDRYSLNFWFYGFIFVLSATYIVTDIRLMFAFVVLVWCYPRNPQNCYTTHIFDVIDAYFHLVNFVCLKIVTKACYRDLIHTRPLQLFSLFRDIQSGKNPVIILCN